MYKTLHLNFYFFQALYYILCREDLALLFLMKDSHLHKKVHQYIQQFVVSYQVYPYMLLYMHKQELYILPDILKM